VPELVLLNFSRTEVTQLHRAAWKGDEGAVSEFATIWEPYKGQSRACFLCSAEAEWEGDQAPFTMMLPEPGVWEKLIAAPLCATCRDLPKMVRWNRCFVLLKRMHKAKTGKQAHFSLIQRR